MTLSLVFRIQALVFAFFGVFMLLAPAAMMGSFGVESSAMMAGVLQKYVSYGFGCGLSKLADAYLGGR